MKKLITSIIALLIAVIASSQTAPIKPVYVKTDSITTNTNNTDLKLVGQGTGLVEIEGAYTLPGVDGTSGYLVKTDGSGAWGYVDPDDVGLSVTNNTNNYMLTATGGSTINGEANMTFDASTLTLAADLDFSGANHNITNMGNVIFQTGATGGTIQTGTSNADKWQLQAYDVDGAAHQTVASAHAGNTVLFHLFSNSLRFTDATDNTKRASFDLSGITTGTTRAYTFPDQAGTFALTSDLSSLGTDNQIPHMNSGGTDFDYSPNFTFDGGLNVSNLRLSSNTLSTSVGSLIFDPAGTNPVVPSDDNVTNLGSGGNRWATGYFGTNVEVGGSPVVVDSDIGVNVQAWDAQLDDISGLATTDGNIIVGDGTNWVAESGATARTSLGAGDVNGPGSSTDNTIPRFDGTSGKIIQGSSVEIDDSDNIDTNGGSLTAADGSFTTGSFTGNIISSDLTTDNSWQDSFGYFAKIDADARIRSISTDAGTWGSAFTFDQLDIGEPTEFENAWGIIRQTNGDGAGDGRLVFTYGTNQDPASNTVNMRLSTSGNLNVSGSLTSGQITSTALTGTGTRLTNVTSGGAVGAITNGSDGDIMKLESGAPTWSSVISYGSPESVTISSGSITVTKTFVSVATEGGAGTDDLNFISAGSDGDILIMRGTNNNDIVIKHAAVVDGSNNIICNGGADVTLSDGSRSNASFIYTGGGWVMTSQGGQ